MFDLLFSNPAAFIIIFGGIVIAIGIHEAAHAYMADYLGDPTPRSLGRTTLNPISHLDPVGTMVILVTGMFGWGKPAPYDPFNLRDVRRDTALIALSGPVSNLILAACLSLIFRFIDLPPTVATTLYLLVRINIGLALFNLIPLPPLDGSKVIGVFLSNESAVRYQSRENPLLLLLLILPIFGGVSIAWIIMGPIMNFLLGILLP